jgi:hypothetical protein
MAAPAPSEAILRAYYDELTDKMRNTREANTEVDLASLQDLVWEHGLDVRCDTLCLILLHSLRDRAMPCVRCGY